MAVGWSGQPEAVGILGAVAEFTKEGCKREIQSGVIYIPF